MDKPWTITVFFDAQDETYGKFRATSVYHVSAASVGEAYSRAERDFSSANCQNVKFGAIVPGTHSVPPGIR